MPPQKHVIESGVVNNASTSQTSMLIAKGVINPDPYTTNTDCRAGSILGSMTFQIDVVPAGSDTGPLNVYFDWFVMFNINDQQTPPTADAVMSSSGADLINQIWHQDGCYIAVPTAVNVADYQVKQWRLNITPPPQWKLLNRGDTVRLYFKFSNAATMGVKIRVIYKEYFP